MKIIIFLILSFTITFSLAKHHRKHSRRSKKQDLILENVSYKPEFTHVNPVLNENCKIEAVPHFDICSSFDSCNSCSNSDLCGKYRKIPLNKIYSFFKIK